MVSDSIREMPRVISRCDPQGAESANARYLCAALAHIVDAEVRGQEPARRGRCLPSGGSFAMRDREPSAYRHGQQNLRPLRVWALVS
jgi:hypothetical protein